MDRIQLNVNLRETKGKGGARKVRARGAVPGVIYGKGYKNINVEVNPKEMLVAISGASGMNTLLDIHVPKKGVVTALLKDYQADVISRDLTHLDFVKIDLAQKLSVAVPIRYVGKSEGVKEGGILEAIRRELEVECLPTAIPEFIEVDVSHLKVGQSMHIHEVKLPDGVILTHPDENFTLVSVVAPKEEEVVVAAPAEGAPAEPEVLTAKKPAEGEVAAPAGDKKAPAGDKKAPEGKPDKK